MKLPKLKIGDMVLVKWVDAHAPEPNSWTTIAGLDDQPIVLGISSLGFFLESRDGYLRVCGEFGGSDVCLDVITRVFNIPLGCIESVKVLEKVA